MTATSENTVAGRVGDTRARPRRSPRARAATAPAKKQKAMATTVKSTTRLFGGVLSGSHEMRYFQTATSVDDTIRRLSELRYDQHL